MLEDDTTLGMGIQLALQGPDVTIALTGTLSQAREMLAQKKFDLLILDVNLPDGSALDLLREVRQWEAVPVILLTANDLEMDVVTGLESVADDYITKPFSLAILRARVNAQLRRRVKFSCVELDGFRFDFERMAFWKNGEPIELSKTEQKLLRLLVENRGQTVSRGVLIPHLDGRGGFCGRERPVRHGEASAGQAGGRPVQPPIPENGVRPRLHMGGEVI